MDRDSYELLKQMEAHLETMEAIHERIANALEVISNHALLQEDKNGAPTSSTFERSVRSCPQG